MAQEIASNQLATASSKAKKSRYRVPTVCSVCRRRKMKCDKVKPHCSSCVKNDTTHLCMYEEQPWAANNEVQRLKDQIYSLQQQNNELKNLLNQKSINSSEDTSPETANYNLIIPDKTSSDPVLELSRDFDLLMLKEAKMAHYGSTSYMAIVSNDPILKNMFKKYLNLQTMGINFKKFFLYDQGFRVVNDGHCGVLAPQGKDFSVMEPDFNKTHEELITSINEILPKKEVIEALVDHFFAEAYVFVPVIDEKSFRKNMESVMTFDREGKSFLVVNSTTLLTTVSLLLSVIRFAFISLPINSKVVPHNLEVQKILNSKTTVGPEFMEFSKACLSQANALRKPTLKNIQALLMLRLYRHFAPEDGDESTDSTIFLALIVQMAHMHGLHRDPSNFSIVDDHATANIWRKIWHTLIYLDAQQAFLFGCPLLISDEYDTKLPVGDSSDSLLEKKIIENYTKKDGFVLLLRQIVRSCSKIKDHPKRSTIENLLNQVEFAIERYPRNSTLLNIANDSFLTKVGKALDLKVKAEMYMIYTSTYYILLLSCGLEEVSTKLKYTQKSAEAAFVLFRLVHDYTRNMSYFNDGSNFESFLSAGIFDCAKRGYQIIISFCCLGMSNSLNLTKYIDDSLFSDSEGLKEWLMPLGAEFSISDQSMIRLQEFIQFCVRLQSRYFTCWRFAYVNKLLIEMLDAEFPGKLEYLHHQVEIHNERSRSDPNLKRIDVYIQGVVQATENANNTDQGATDVWSELVDGANQSKFDYLNPSFDKFKDIGDPYFNDNGFQGSDNFTFQDYNTFLTPNGHSPLNFGSFSTSSISDRNPNNISNFPKKSSFSTDEVSPRTDSDQSQIIDQKSYDFNILGIPTPNGMDPQDIMKANVSDHDLALQVAESMFGGSNDLFTNDMN